MSKKIITTDFDYGSVDSETAAKLEYFAKSGKALIRRNQIKFLADMGKLLSEAREAMAKHGDGKFIKWATSEFDVSKNTVYRYVNAWDRMLSQNGTNYLNWSKSAVYLASSEELPKLVQKKLAALATKDMVRESDVKRLIEASKPKPEPDPEPASNDVLVDSEYEHDESEIEAEFNETESGNEPESVPEPPQAAIMLDRLGKPIPTHLRPASELAILLQATGREVDKFRALAKGLAAKPGGEWLNLQSIDDAVRALKNQFQDAQFYAVCPRCESKGCERCGQFGYLPEHRKNIL